VTRSAATAPVDGDLVLARTAIPLDECTSTLTRRPYPPRPRLRALGECAGTATSRPNPSAQTRLQALVLAQYAAGRSLREIAELTDRPFSGLPDILDEHGMVRPGVGGAVVAVGHEGCEGAS